MQVTKINYSESRKVTTDKKYESRLVSCSAEAEVSEEENITTAYGELKFLVKEEIKKEL